MLLRLAALLCLGFSVALVVAWLPAMFVTPAREAIGASQASQPRWDVEVQTCFARTVVVFEHKYLNWLQAPPADAIVCDLDSWVMQRRAFERNDPPSAYYKPAHQLIESPYWSRAFSVPTKGDRDIQFIDTAQGWPFRCVAGYWAQSTSRRGKYVSQWVLEIPISQYGVVPVGLPFRPIWFGIAANTLFNVLWICLVFAGVRACRSCIRRRRGLCHVCSYPVGGSLRCTECGASLSPRDANLDTHPAGDLVRCAIVAEKV